MRMPFFNPGRGIVLCCLNALAVISTACGTSPSNTQIPKKASEITIADVNDDTFMSVQERWTKLLTALKLKNDGSAESLKTPSQYFENSTEGRVSYAQLQTTLTDAHLQTAARTACAEIVDFQSLSAGKKFDANLLLLSDLNSVRWYLLKYRRKLTDGTTDPTVYGAIVSAPEATGNFPVVAYAHAGDNGLRLFELAAVLAEKQEQYIVVAPAFPGEGIFTADIFAATEIFAGVGTSEPYSTDAEDLLAAHNCLVGNTTAPAALTSIRSRIKTTANGKTVSGTLGVSRGGMASLIAHAKNAALISAGRPEAQHFSCAATAINPSSLVFAEFRVYLEATIRGTAESTAFYTLPTAPQLNAFLKDYREGKAGVTAESAALDIQKRDSTFNAGLILQSLRNWGPQGGKGAMLNMHATLDQKIPFSQALIGGKIFSEQNQNLTSAPGVHLTSLGFSPQPTDSSDGVTLPVGSDMHGDLVWLRSRATLNASQVNTTTWTAEALPTSDSNYHKSPLTVLWNWLENTTSGCASTY